ncbi:MAG TPA: helix-turn-helix transcriptional regulator [Afifellaceae bacterium]|nr:helix-turn-helix transcriptional regulator [Afifellaceae bacterium]
MDKRNLGPIFRERLKVVLDRFAGSQAEFARTIGLDRSALSQLLSEHSTRLPRAETLQAIAERHGVSVDWLLGLSQSELFSAEIKPMLEIEDTDGSSSDTLIAQWHREAIGYKIRYVPTTIPDLLRTEAVIAYDFLRGRGPDEQIQIKDAESRLDYSRRPETDMEVCMPVQQVRLLAEGRGIWSGLSRENRRIQIDYMADLLDELYPTFRLFLFDELEVFSVPYTVFGPLRAAIYVGDMYFVLNGTDHIRALSRHFDNLIKRAVINAHRSADYLRGLKVE